MSNVGGDENVVPTSRSEEFRVFDTLPEWLRREISLAPYNYCVKDISQWYMRCWLEGRSDEEIITLFRRSCK